MEVYFDEIHTKEKFDNFFIFKKELGSGTYGRVIYAIDKKTNQEVAVKIIKRKKSSDYIKIMREIYILKSLKHKNIVQLIDHYETNLETYIVMEYIKGGTLKQLVDKRKSEKNPFKESEVSLIMKNLLEGVNYLHTNQIVHRDIKPDNILITDHNDLSSIKIVDFGLSGHNIDTNEDYSICGTLLFMAPELILKSFYSSSIDVWSCGIIMFILLNEGKHPFYEKKDTNKIFKKKLEKPEINFFNKVSRMAEDLFRRMVEISHFKRYKSNDALKHPFITRNRFDKIPITFFENWKRKDLKEKFKEFLGSIIFLRINLKKSTKSLSLEYIKKAQNYSKISQEKKIKTLMTCLSIKEETENPIIDFVKTEEEENKIEGNEQENEIVKNPSPKIKQCKFNMSGSNKHKKTEIKFYQGLTPLKISPEKRLSDSLKVRKIYDDHHEFKGSICSSPIKVTKSKLSIFSPMRQTKINWVTGRVDDNKLDFQLKIERLNEKGFNAVKNKSLKPIHTIHSQERNYSNLRTERYFVLPKIENNFMKKHL